MPDRCTYWWADFPARKSSSWQKILRLNVVFFVPCSGVSLTLSLFFIFLYFFRFVFIFVLNRFAVTNSLCIARFMQGKARIHAKRNDRIFKFLRIKRELWNVVEICISKIMHLAQCNFAKDLCSWFFHLWIFYANPDFNANIVQLQIGNIHFLKGCTFYIFT